MENEKIKLVIELDKDIYDEVNHFDNLTLYGDNPFIYKILKTLARSKPYESKYVMKKGER